MANILKSRSFVFPALCLVIINTAILIHFHDRFWIPQDEGVFAHIADRMLSGEILHKDIEDVHPGYNNFVNYFAFKAFGRNLVSLRYPLILAALCQSLIIFWLLYKPLGSIGALLGALAPTIFGVIQFLNPNHHWYCLLLAIMLIGWLQLANIPDRRRYMVVGILLISIYLFRQLTAVYVGAGALLYIFLEQSGHDKKEKSFMPSALLAFIFLLLFVYLAKAAHISTIVLYAIGPLVLTLYAAKNVSLSQKSFINICGYITAGIIVGLLPIILYHTYHQSLGAWIHDTIARTVSVMQQPFLDSVLYTDYMVEGAKVMMRPAHVLEFLNGLYWLLLPLANTLLFLFIIQSLIRHKMNQNRKLLLPIMALFYGLVSTHNSIAVYMYFALGLTIPALLLMARHRRLSYRGIILMTGLFAVIALYSQAAQPLLVRTFSETIRGARINFVNTKNTFKDMNLSIDPYTFHTYKEVLALIDQNTEPDDFIFALPNNPEIYYLSQRKNPFRFFSVDHGVTNREELKQVFNVFQSTPPKIIIHKTEDKRTTLFSREIMKYVKANYHLLGKYAIFDIYVDSQ